MTGEAGDGSGGTALRWWSRAARWSCCFWPVCWRCTVPRFSFFNENGDLGGVVCEHSPSAPSACTVDAVEHRPFPPPGSLQMCDPTFRTGAPLDQLAKARRELDLLAQGPGPAPSGNGDVLHTHGLEGGLHFRFAIAAVGGDRLGDFAEELGHAGDGRSEHGRIGRVALFHGVVDNDALGVVGDLCLVNRTRRDDRDVPCGWGGRRCRVTRPPGWRRRGRRRPGGCGSGPRSVPLPRSSAPARPPERWPYPRPNRPLAATLAGHLWPRNGRL